MTYHLLLLDCLLLLWKCIHHYNKLLLLSDDLPFAVAGLPTVAMEMHTPL